MDAIKTRAFDAARYLSAMMEGNDPALIRHALGTIARAHGMAELARTAGLGPKSLYKTLGEDGNPELGTFLKVLSAMGLRLGVQPIGDLSSLAGEAATAVAKPALAKRPPRLQGAKAASPPTASRSTRAKERERVA
jgi:probable addiction module antidote protein